MSKTPKPTGQRSTSEAVEILNRRYVGTDPARKAAADQAFESALVGQIIYQARVQAGLTQTQLADLIDSDQSVVSRLEDADYEGHSLGMLRRIAAALGKRLEIRFVDAA